jgi:GH25 family lysozyme M1 (1,4-beta-N-acetylmuramidase)
MITVVIVSTAFQSQEDVPEQITWHRHFNAEPDDRSPYAALTTTIWQYSYKAMISGRKLHIDFNFVSGVDPEKSWVKYPRIRNKEVDKQLLNHEQGHVNINYILRKQGDLILRNQNYTVNNYQKLIRSTANRISKHYSEMQERYDRETKHGSDLAAQKKWDNYLQKELSKYL